MLAVRQISDDCIEEHIATASLNAMGNLYIDDVLEVVERGVKNLPTYLELYRKAINQAWVPDELDFSLDRQEWQQLPRATKKRRLWSMRMFFAGEERVAA